MLEKRKAKTVDPVFPEGVHEIQQETLFPCVRTPLVCILAEALDVDTSFLVANYCGCLQKQLVIAHKSYDFLYNVKLRASLKTWMKQNFDIQERLKPILPTIEQIMEMPEILPFWSKIRAIICLKRGSLQVFF